MHWTPEYEAAWRLMWAGAAVIVTAVAAFVAGFLLARAYLVPVGAAAGSAAGFGISLVRVSARRRRNLYPYGVRPAAALTRNPAK